MFTRCLLVIIPLLLCLTACASEPVEEKLPVAALIGSWHPGSHPDVILGQILRNYSMDGSGIASRLRLASLYVDKPRATDISAKLAAEYHFQLCNSVEDALTLGTGKLAVGGVFLCTEHGDYPSSPIGHVLYRHRALFEEIVKVFEASGRVVPVFIDKHVADNWEDARYIYETAKRMKIPLMAGSSVPGAWRIPAVDVRANARLKEIVGISYHTLDSYGFHGLEMVQALAERRRGGETGVASVQTVVGPAVWDAAGTAYDPELLADALARHQPPLTIEQAKQKVKEPVLFIITYRDGLRAELFTLNPIVTQWAAAWRYSPGEKESTLCWLDEKSKKMRHFSLLTSGIETMFLTGTPSWPVERTLLSSGMLDAALISKAEGGRVVETPGMSRISYQAYWHWTALPIPADGNGK